MNKLMNLEYSSALLDISEANPSFDVGKLRIAYTGKNRNNSFISKEAFEDAIPTMYGCPVVARYSVEDDEIGSHDAELVRDKDGDLKYVVRTEPIGFVPPGAHWEWEIIEDNNVMHQYLTTEVVLWRRQPAYQKVKDNGITDQSMEITVKEGEMCDDYYNILTFYFTAFCLLGSAEPCFESAALLTFRKEDMKKQLSEMVEDFKLAFENDNRFKEKEGNVTKMDKLKELLEKYSLTAEDLEFEVEGLTDEELEAKFDEFYDESDPEPATNPEPVEPEVDPAPAEPENFELAGKVYETLSDLIRTKETYETEYGVRPKYYMVDYDSELKEVYFEDTTDWKLYGAAYSFDGDEIKIDFDNVKRKKFAILDYVEGSDDDAVFNHEEYYSTVIEDIKAKHKEEYGELEEKYNALITSQNKEASKALFEKFEAKLAGDPEFEALKKNTEIDAKELETKLYAMLGRKQFNLKNDKPTTKSPKAPVVIKDRDNDEKPYGDYFNY